MRLEEAITNLTRFSPPAVPELRYIQTAAQKVLDRWPDVSVTLNPREREALAVHLRDRVTNSNWSDARISFVLAAAHAVFDLERRDCEDLNESRAFLLAEVRASRSETFLSGMLAAHLESFVAGAAHTRALAVVLDTARDRMSPSGQRLLDELPELVNATDGPRRLAVRMPRMADPFLELTRSGLRNPHGPGFMERAHEEMSALVRPELSSRDRIDWYIDWLRPPGRDARSSGAEQAIEALTYPWLNAAPTDQLRSYLVEALIEMYGDPRIRSGGVWAGVDPAHMRVIHRWLTREDMRFFTGVVDAAQKDAMWPPRRDFWLQLFDEKLIDAAWVAFSSQATEYARAHLMRQDARNADSRFRFQRARQNTSLLIMWIGNKVMVDGCHSYKTHVFDQDDPMAPKLSQDGYDCDEIMRASPESKSHSSIDSWKRWVRDMINADVKRSQRTRPYTKVYRPRASGPSYAAPPRPSAPPSPRREPPTQAQLDLRNRGAGGGTTRPAADPPSTLQSRVIIAPPLAPRPDTSRTGGRTSTAPDQSLLDLLIRTGPTAATALLNHFARMADGKTRTLLSPNARAGLEWILTEKVPPPVNLRNAIKHLLESMETFGQGPAGIITRAARASSETPPMPTVPPPLPDNAPQRLETFFRHADAMEVFARERYAFSAERTLGTALMKLRARNADLRPAEIHHLQQLYELMRRHASGGRR